ncbi:MAG: glycosyltransferase family 2 protein [Oligoflexia bacterium]|nr:glycosyltransferase family 2 protein [Oligoflexia bacterium]
MFFVESLDELSSRIEKMPSELDLSIVIITLNEEKNLKRALNSVSWASEVIVVDSGSLDKTKEIALEAKNTQFFVNPWAGYGQQKNWAIGQCTKSWILFLDADEEISQELKNELKKFFSSSLSEQKAGASFPRKTYYLGRWIMYGGWYPNRLTRMIKKGAGQWTEPDVHEKLDCAGVVHEFSSDIYHYTFSDVGEQVQTNIRFSRLGAIAAMKRGEKGSLWKILTKPVGKFLETYIWKRGFLDGIPGFVISINAAHSIFMKYVELRFVQNSIDR